MRQKKPPVHTTRLREGRLHRLHTVGWVEHSETHRLIPLRPQSCLDFCSFLPCAPAVSLAAEAKRHRWLRETMQLQFQGTSGVLRLLPAPLNSRGLFNWGPLLPHPFFHHSIIDEFVKSRKTPHLSLRAKRSNLVTSRRHMRLPRRFALRNDGVGLFTKPSLFPIYHFIIPPFSTSTF